MLKINEVSYLLVEGKKVFTTNEMKEVAVHMMKDGSHFFLAEGGDKVIKVLLGLFILHSVEEFHLPLEEWDKVKVGYLDDDPFNLSADNLYLIYPEEGIPYPDKPGFFYIPGLELNAINKVGEVYRSLRGDLYRSLDEDMVVSGTYPIARTDVTKGDDRKYIHRLLGVTLKNPPKHYPKLLVDHDNGDKLDYSLDNLIWVTPTQNINKAYYDQDLRNDNHPITVYDTETNTTLCYVAKAEFARAMGVDPWVISLVMQRKRSVYKDRYVLKGEDDKRSFQEVLDTPRLSIKGVKARNVFTGDVETFFSLSEAVRQTGVTKGVIRLAITTENPRAVSNDRQFKMDSDETPWVELNEWELECVRRGMRSDSSAYLLTNVHTKEEQVVYGNDEVARLTGANPRTVMVCARTGKRLLKKFVLKKLTR